MEEPKKRTTLARTGNKKSQVKEDFIDMGGRIFHDVVWPKGKDMISAAVDVILYGEVRGRNSTNKPLNVIDFTNYNQPYNIYGAPQQTNPGVPVRNNYQAGSKRWRFEDVLFDSAEEATQVWYQLRDIARQEHIISINRYYDVCRADVQVPHTMENMGWIESDLGNSPRILQKMFGDDYKYIIALPNIRHIGGR